MQPRIAFRLFALSLLLLLAACASTPRVATQADPSADFGRYRSFAFYTPLALEQHGYTTSPATVSARRCGHRWRHAATPMTKPARTCG